MNTSSTPEAMPIPASKPLAELHEGAKPLSFLLFLAVVASLMATVTSVFGVLAAHGQVPTHELWVTLVAAIPALLGSVFCAMASWSTYTLGPTRTRLEKISLRLLAFTSFCLTVIFWLLALHLVVSN
jgi:hypothetical protein